MTSMEDFLSNFIKIKSRKHVRLHFGKFIPKLSNQPLPVSSHKRKKEKEKKI